MHEDKIKKTRCPKNYALSEVEVADVVGCTVSYVKKIRSSRPVNSYLAKTILAVDEIANKQKSLLINNLKQL